MTFANAGADVAVCDINVKGEDYDLEGTARGYLMTQQLHDIGMIQQRAHTGGHIDVVPTYVGIIRVTREAETKWTKLVNQLVEEWETTNVEFKRELNLSRDKEKAEFVRDILGLATTNSSGRRFLVIGFDDKTHLFVQSVDPYITQEHLEQMLYVYSEPSPRTKYTVVPWASGTIAIIEILDPHKKSLIVLRNILEVRRALRLDKSTFAMVAIQRVRHQES